MNRETERLFVKFCQDELDARKDKIIEELTQIERWENAKSSAMKHYNELIKEADARIRGWRNELEAGGTEEDIEVCWKMNDPEKGKKALYRLDTMKRIRVEEMGLFDGAGTEDEPDPPTPEAMEDGEPVKLKPAKTVICNGCGRCDGTEPICARCGKPVDCSIRLLGEGCVCDDCFYSDDQEDTPDKTDKTDKTDPPTPEAMEDGKDEPKDGDPVKLKPTKTIICNGCGRCDGTRHICARCGKPAEYYMQLPGEGCVCEDCSYGSDEPEDTPYKTDKTDKTDVSGEVCCKCGSSDGNGIYHISDGPICFNCVINRNHKKYVELNERMVKVKEAGKQLLFRASFGYGVCSDKADMTCFRFRDHDHGWGLDIYEPGKVTDMTGAAKRLYVWLLNNGAKED